MVMLIFATVATIGYFGCWKYFFAVQTTSGNLRFSIWPIFGVMIPVIGVVVGWKYFLFGAPLKPTIEEIKKANAGKWDGASVENLIDFIDDNSAASVIASNSEWLKNNWHNMHYTEKVNWVQEREKRLKDHFCAVTDSPSFIKALQDADKDYIRAEIRVG